MNTPFPCILSSTSSTEFIKTLSSEKFGFVESFANLADFVLAKNAPIKIRKVLKSFNSKHQLKHSKASKNQCFKFKSQCADSNSAKPTWNQVQNESKERMLRHTYNYNLAKSYNLSYLIPKCIKPPIHLSNIPNPILAPQYAK